MLRTGLVSVTFRQHGPAEIINLARRAGLEGIEWGGDVHVPPGIHHLAREVRNMTLAAGLKIAGYGSYYRAGCDDREFDKFKTVLETALNLGAPVIRIWAGVKDSKDVGKDYFANVVEGTGTIAEMAANVNIAIAYEFHTHTLTDTNESAYQLLSFAKHANIKTYWQPHSLMNTEERLEGLKKIGSWLSNIHVFHWILDRQGHKRRRPLGEGLDEWKRYIKYIAGLGTDSFALLEFVKGDCEEQFMKDAEVLKRLVKRDIQKV